jgi:23S rRNA pseudouridine1911/1915/1917 synthase
VYPDCFEFIIEEGDSQRLDSLLYYNFAKRPDLPKPSRTQISTWIKNGYVSVNSLLIQKPSYIIESKSFINITFPPKITKKTSVTKFFPEILYEDDYLLAINKPSDLIVHHGSGTQNEFTLVDLVKERFPMHSWDGFDNRAGIVHRLDKETTGVLLIAKSLEALNFLSKQFAERVIRKTYVALVSGSYKSNSPFFTLDSGIINSFLGRSLVDRKKITVVEKGGKQAVTDWEVIERVGNFLLIRFLPKTGRTHQLRVHSFHLNTPIVGDKVYNLPINYDITQDKIVKNFKGMALHAASLTFNHPISNTLVKIEAPLPNNFLVLLQSIRDSYKCLQN